jgi:dolichol-phosphate mannosyltransferase
MKLAIAVPTYNEAANIKKIIPAISKSIKDYPKLTTTLFIVDDNSPDKTGDIAEKLGEQYKTTHFQIEVLHRAKKEGLGQAYIYAFKKILSKKFDYILQMDADLSHDPRYIPAMLDATKKADLIIGSRYIKGGATPDWSWNRKLQSQGGNWYSRLFLGSRITDYTGGYNMFSAQLLHDLNLDSLQANGYGFLIVLKYRALQLCENVQQIPIIFRDRQHGKSKIPRNTIFKNLMLVPKIKYKQLYDHS